MIGSLIFIAVKSTPEVSAAVNMIGAHVESPIKESVVDSNERV